MNGNTLPPSDPTGTPSTITEELGLPEENDISTPPAAEEPTNSHDAEERAPNTGPSDSVSDETPAVMEVEYYNREAFPDEGEVGKIYVDSMTDTRYQWHPGTGYVTRETYRAVVTGEVNPDEFMDGSQPSSLLDFTPQPNVQQTSEARVVGSKDARRPKEYTSENSLSLLNGRLSELSEHAARNYPNIDIGTSQKGQHWSQSIKDGRGSQLMGDAYAGSVSNPDSLWRQSVTAGAEQLQAGRPKFESSEDGGRLSGEQAMMKLQSVLGLGAIVRIPLWHSGMWICLKAPTEAALLELDRRIAQEKIDLGRLTSGLVFSNTSVYTISYLVNFALAHVYEASFKFTQETTREQELKSVILSTDIPTIIWGLLCAIYPNGYPHREPCVRDPTKCLHVVEEMINIGKLSWTNERALSENQRRHMSKKTDKFTKEQLLSYQSEHGYNDKRTVVLHDRLSMELRVPTILEYERAGFAWVDSITEQVDRSFGGGIDEETRIRYINEQGQMTALRQYVHWVDRLVIDGTTVVDDRDTLSDTLSTLTTNTQVFDAFFDGVGKFIDITTISLIALPKYNCPKCGEPMHDRYKMHPYLVPIDVVMVFFILIAQRITQVLDRQAT